MRATRRPDRAGEGTMTAQQWSTHAAGSGGGLGHRRRVVLRNGRAGEANHQLQVAPHRQYAPLGVSCKCRVSRRRMAAFRRVPPLRRTRPDVLGAPQRPWCIVAIQHCNALHRDERRTADMSRCGTACQSGGCPSRRSRPHACTLPRHERTVLGSAVSVQRRSGGIVGVRWHHVVRCDSVRVRLGAATGGFKIGSRAVAGAVRRRCGDRF